MKNLISLLVLIASTMSCTDYSGFSETFVHCSDEPTRFENTYSHVDSDRSCVLPWHDHHFRDVMSLVHIENDIYIIKCFGLSLETVRDGCDFTIKEQELELSGKTRKISGYGKHSRRIDNDSGPSGYRLQFDITYLYDGIVSECYFEGTKFD